MRKKRGIFSTSPRPTRKHIRKKKETLPAAAFSGEFKQRKAAALRCHSGWIGLDIDGLTPKQTQDVKAALRKRDDIIFAFISPSGRGIKAFVCVNPVPKTPNEHKIAYNAIVDAFQDFTQKYNIKIDTGASDVSRLCFLAYDPEAIHNADPEIIHVDLTEPPASHPNRRFPGKVGNSFSVEDVDSDVLDFIPNDLDYERWRNVGMGIKAAGLPFSVFSQWTGGQRKRSTGDWVTIDPEKIWQSFRSSGIGWGTVVHYAQEFGYQPPVRTPKLYRKSEKQTPAPERQTLQENRAARETAADAFLETRESAREKADPKIKILLVKDSTGTGKTTTFFSKAQTHKRHVLAMLSHTELAQQAVAIASSYGFENPLKLRSREENWEASGLEQIPEPLRDVRHFKLNICIKVDKVREYEEKRMPARHFCETKCGFKEQCPYLAQYVGLEQRDFVATCTPNLLFDPRWGGYLQTLLEGVPRLAILDDYSVDSLYPLFQFKQSEFETLSQLWHGTVTGAFIKSVLGAFLESQPAAIFPIFKEALEALTDDVRNEIAFNLTQHVRVGTIERASDPKFEQATRRLISDRFIKYDDGSKSDWIPRDSKAYLYLEQRESELKDTPDALKFNFIDPSIVKNSKIGTTQNYPIDALSALNKGVPIQKITPRFSRGVTPIDTLKILCASVKIPENAPVSRKVSKSGENTLEFYLPPQAPIGTVSQIAMLSATSDTESVKNAFKGQNVDFSVHEGGQLAWAEGVQVWQYAHARITSSSVFEFEIDADDKRKLQEPPIGLTETAERRLAKLNAFAESVDGRSVFVSYKEFTTLFVEAVNKFDDVTHFDKLIGLNFDGLKFLAVFGYPKVRHEVVIEHAQKQFASESEALPKGLYDEVTQTAEFQEDGITITERRYLDPRLEKIRHQLATQKIEQAIGRARLPVWRNTTTLVFTNALVPNITERAALFGLEAFMKAKTLDGLSRLEREITEARRGWRCGQTHSFDRLLATHRRTPDRKRAIEKESRPRRRNCAACWGGGVATDNCGRIEHQQIDSFAGVAKTTRPIRITN